MEPTKPNQAKRMSNHIEEYFAQSPQSKEVLTSKELFRADPENTDIKTDLSYQEIILINKLMFNDSLLKSKGLEPIYKDFINRYLRLKISLDRKSRSEFVDMNRGQTKTDDVLNTLDKVKNITATKT